MGYQSFGSKTSPRKGRVIENKIYKTIQNKLQNQSLERDLGGFTSRLRPENPVNTMMQSSIQEFLDETKSIEEDLMKLKQLSVEK